MKGSRVSPAPHHVARTSRWRHVGGRPQKWAGDGWLPLLRALGPFIMLGVVTCDASGGLQPALSYSSPKIRAGWWDTCRDALPGMPRQPWCRAWTRHGTMSFSPWWPVHAAHGRSWHAVVGDVGPAGVFLSLLETQVLPKFSVGVCGCWDLVHGLHAPSGALRPMLKSGGALAPELPGHHHLCTPGGRFPPSQQQGGGAEALGDGEAQDAAGPGQAAEADGGGLPVAAAGGEGPGEWPPALAPSGKWRNSHRVIEFDLPGWKRQFSLEERSFQQPNLSHPFISRSRKGLTELLHFKRNIWKLGQILNTCDSVLISFYNAFEIRAGES